MAQVVHNNENKHAEAKQAEERAECSFCLEDIDPHNQIKLPCKHQFHRPCMTGWANEHKNRDVTCPQWCDFYTHLLFISFFSHIHIHNTNTTQHKAPTSS